MTKKGTTFLSTGCCVGPSHTRCVEEVSNTDAVPVDLATDGRSHFTMNCVQPNGQISRPIQVVEIC